MFEFKKKNQTMKGVKEEISAHDLFLASSDKGIKGILKKSVRKGRSEETLLNFSLLSIHQ
jgi:hypothetical protein